jgi:hypothetical protein
MSEGKGDASMSCLGMLSAMPERKLDVSVGDFEEKDITLEFSVFIRKDPKTVNTL